MRVGRCAFAFIPVLWVDARRAAREGLRLKEGCTRRRLPTVGNAEGGGGRILEGNTELRDGVGRGHKRLAGLTVTPQKWGALPPAPPPPPPLWMLNADLHAAGHRAAEQHRQAKELFGGIAPRGDLFFGRVKIRSGKVWNWSFETKGNFGIRPLAAASWCVLHGPSRRS